jgi:hypothetical protein
MKRASAINFLVLSCALHLTIMPAPSNAESAQPNETAANALLLTITSEKATYQSGEKIVIRAIVKNVGDQTLMLKYENPLQFFFRFLIVRMSGVNSGIAALTQFGREQLIPAHNIMGVKGFQFQPGMELRGDMPVSDFYDMTAPGSYRIVCFVQPEPYMTVAQRPRLRSKELVIAVAQ